MDSNKKISFGFSKLNKKPAVLQLKHSEQKKVELVECLEGQSIKIKDAPEVVNEPLVIPVKDNKKNLIDRIKDAKSKQKQFNQTETQQEDNRPDSELSIEELAVRELIKDAKNRLSNKNSTNSSFILPMKDDESTFDGEKEPTLDDYEKVPVGDYGMAMLRGMGWKEGTGIGKNPTKIQIANLPELRPKGLGLGASKMIKVETPNVPACDKDGNMLIIKKGTYVKIIAGSHKGEYCEVQGLDDEAGTVIVKTSLKGEMLTLNEFLIVPVTKEEYFKDSKVLNNAKFEKYKELLDNNFENHPKAKYTSKEVEEGDSSSKKYKQENIHHKMSRKHEVKRESDEEIHESSKNKLHKNYKHHNTYRSKERDSCSSDSDSRDRKRSDKKKQKKRRDKSQSRADDHKSDRHKYKNKHESKSSSSDHHRKGTSKKNKSKSRHGRGSSSESSTD